jgi:hypothetical protein
MLTTCLNRAARNNALRPATFRVRTRVGALVLAVAGWLALFLRRSGRRGWELRVPSGGCPNCRLSAENKGVSALHQNPAILLLVFEYPGGDVHVWISWQIG